MKLISNILFGLGLGIMIILSLGNVWRQYSLLREAGKENKALEDKVSSLQDENRKLLRTIDYATSSAFMERQARILLGVGTSRDFWIKGLKEKKYTDEFLTR
ncbi:MAG: hypothetical protein WC841_05300 [Candidatus Shapirobacteria bacterium]|jgi:hypothetical protein